MEELYVVIDEDGTVHLEAYDHDGVLVLMQRLEAEDTIVRNYRDMKLKRKRWWNL